jgi:hypothetical protein
MRVRERVREISKVRVRDNKAKYLCNVDEIIPQLYWYL